MSWAKVNHDLNKADGPTGEVLLASQLYEDKVLNM
jgi:hypothetical protein